MAALTHEHETRIRDLAATVRNCGSARYTRSAARLADEAEWLIEALPDGWRAGDDLTATALAYLQ